MAAIASRPQVFKIASQVRPFSNWDLMIGMKVAFTPVMSVAKLGQHSIGRWVTEVGLPEQSDNLWLPTAVNTPPPIALEAEDSQPAMTRVVAALGASTTTFIMFTLSRAAVLFARTAGSEFRTARGRARAGYPRTLRNSL